MESVHTLSILSHLKMKPGCAKRGTSMLEKVPSLRACYRFKFVLLYENTLHISTGTETNVQELKIFFKKNAKRVMYSFNNREVKGEIKLNATKPISFHYYEKRILRYKNLANLKGTNHTTPNKLSEETLFFLKAI